MELVHHCLHRLFIPTINDYYLKKRSVGEYMKRCQTGDLLFVEDNFPLLQFATGSPFIHCGVIIVKPRSTPNQPPKVFVLTTGCNAQSVDHATGTKSNGPRLVWFEDFIREWSMDARFVVRPYVDSDHVIDSQFQLKQFVYKLFYNYIESAASTPVLSIASSSGMDHVEAKPSPSFSDSSRSKRETFFIPSNENSPANNLRSIRSFLTIQSHKPDPNRRGTALSDSPKLNEDVLQFLPKGKRTRKMSVLPQPITRKRSMVTYIPTFKKTSYLFAADFTLLVLSELGIVTSHISPLAIPTFFSGSFSSDYGRYEKPFEIV